MFVAGPIIDVDPPVFPNGSVTVATPDQARHEVARQVAAGYDFIKLFPRFEKSTYRAAIDAAHEHGRLVTGHAMTGEPFAEVLAAGIDAIEHMDGHAYALQDPPLGADDKWPDEAHRAETQLGYWLTVNLEQVDSFAADLAHSGTWTIPTLVALGSHFRTEAEVQAAMQSDLARIASPSALAWWRSVVVDEATAAKSGRAHEIRLRFVRALHDAGAGLLAGTDSGNPFVVHGAALHEELERFVDAGLTPYEALTKATVQAARFLGQDDEFGRVAPGPRADLVLLSENPLEDIRHTREIVGVMLRGEWATASELERRRIEIETELAAIAAPEPANTTN